jgi:hypothetical protein
MRSISTYRFAAFVFALLLTIFGIASVQQAYAQVRTPVPRQTPGPVVIPPNVTGVPVQTQPVQLPPAQLPPLRGFVDLHTHPMANLGFGGKLLYGGVDGFKDAQGNPQGTFLPADPVCQHNVQAGSMEQALGHDRSTHGGPIIRAKDVLHPVYNYNPCGNVARGKIIKAVQGALESGSNPGEDSCGLWYPTEDNQTFCQVFPFSDWPTWDDVTHQKMWVNWILRAYAGGLRVMVALAVNNKLLGDVVTVGNLSDTPDLPTDDMTTADQQIGEIKRFVGNHSDWMQVANNSQDIYNIVSSNRLAVVIGVEIDQIGNFKPVAPPSDAQIRAEIDRLYAEGVRYIFPIHLVDTVFGGTAAYEDLFNVANVYEDGDVWHLTCANNPQTDTNIKYQFAGDVGKWGADFVAKLSAMGLSIPLHGDPSCGNFGQKNSLGLKPAGYTAISEMMRLGMLIDIDHMSQQAVDDTLAFASRPDVRYPVMSGHNSVRGDTLLPGDVPTERNFRPDQYVAIGALHGMAGVGNVKRNAWQWLTMYKDVLLNMCAGASNCAISGGFGTDTDGLEPGSPPPSGHPPVTYGTYSRQDALTGCGSGSTAGYKLCAQRPMTSLLKVPISFYGGPVGGSGQTWDYNVVGFAHYGLLPDFLQDARNMPVVSIGGGGGAALVDNNVLNGADYFYHTWQIAEARSKCVLTPACVNAPATTPVQIGPNLSIATSAQTNAARSTGPTLNPILSASVCLTSDGKNCLPPNTLAPPMGQPRNAIVTVSSGGQPVGGAAISVSGQTSGALTNASGVAVLNYNGCISTTRSPVGVPVAIPAPCQGAAAKSGYQTVAINLP